MNALYVTVSIPLLLLLAGFNHAHGLTTFGKTNSQGTQPQLPSVQGKACVTQDSCNLVKGTTCLKGYCLCGDNTHANNGVCKAQFKGPRHICNTDEECIDGADCLPNTDKNKTVNAPDKTCACQEGLYEVGGICGDGSRVMVLPRLILMITILVRSLN